MTVYCPKCGKPTDALYGGKCLSCLSETGSPLSLPERIDIQKCRQCQRVRVHGKWVEETSQVLGEIAQKQLKVRHFKNPRLSADLHPQKDGTVKATLCAHVRAHDQIASLCADTVLRFVAATCGACARVSSDYFEATLQMRIGKKPGAKRVHSLYRELDALLAPLREDDPLARIVKTVPAPTGVDFLLGSRRAAKAVARHYEHVTGKKPVVSTTLAGVDQKGKEKKRYTYCIRL